MRWPARHSEASVMWSLDPACARGVLSGTGRRDLVLSRPGRRERCIGDRGRIDLLIEGHKDHGAQDDVEFAIGGLDADYVGC